MKKKPHNDEIDVTNLIFNLWENKIKIINITAAFLILGFLYFNILPKEFGLTTNIKPISTFESQKYKLYNSLAEETLSEETLAEQTLAKQTLAEQTLAEETLDEETSYENLTIFNQDNFLNLFISKIQTEEFLEKAIIKFQLVNKDNFINEEDYKEEITKTAISIIDQMTPPLNDGINRSKNSLYWKFNFKITDKKKWRNFLEHIEKKTNEEIRLSLINRFNTEMEILNVKLKYQLEDIDAKILNELDDYKALIASRLEFLKEQAEIARTLKIAKNTLTSNNFRTEVAIITNNGSEDSYYLKGYEMIEKEISLINSRENDKAFIPNIRELEKKKTFDFAR